MIGWTRRMHEPAGQALTLERSSPARPFKLRALRVPSSSLQLSTHYRCPTPSSSQISIARASPCATRCAGDTSHSYFRPNTLIHPTWPTLMTSSSLSLAVMKKPTLKKARRKYPSQLEHVATAFFSSFSSSYPSLLFSSLCHRTITPTWH